MYNIMEDLINEKFYKTREEVGFKLSLYNAYKVIDDKQYTELMDLANEKYKDETIEQPTKPIETNTEVSTQ